MLDSSVGSLYAKRRARIAAGMTATICVIASLGCLLGGSSSSLSTILLLIGWPAGLLAYGLARQIEQLRDFETRDTFDAWARLNASAFGSVAWPLIGMTLLIPLSLHFLVFLVFGRSQWVFSNEGLRAFSAYIGVSTLMVGVAYATLIVSACRFARRLTGPGGTEDLGEKEGLRALGLATAAGCIPGVVFAGAPPLGVAVTGLLFVPGSYRLLNRLYWQESETLIELERAQVSNDRVETFDRCKGLVLHQNLPPAQRASALTFLLRNYERAEVATLLNEVMERGPKLLILQALHACTEITHRPPIELLVRIAKRNDVLLTPIAIKLIGLSGGTNAEGVLLDLLASPSIMARRAVVDAIARVGTRRSIEPIRAVIHRPTRDRVLEVAAEEAILRIQRRLGPSRPGALSLVAHTRDVGAVSLSDDKQGGISVTEEGKVQ